MKRIVIALMLFLAGCSGGGNSPPPSPQGGWVCFHCTGMSLSANGDFTFPSIGGAVGYIYTTPLGVSPGRVLTLTYTVGGSGTVLPSAASGTGEAQVRLFLWRKNDDLACSQTTEWYRLWSQSGVGPLTPGQHTITALVSSTQWSDCLGHIDDTTGARFADTVANLLGVGFTFGAEFFGHGVYSTGNNTFTVNSFTVQ